MKARAWFYGPTGFGSSGANVQPVENACPVCRPYSRPKYQELSDGRIVPCYACNREEFERYALRG
jgi:hypothetical protein